MADDIRTAFVLGGGGILGAAEVGMLKALLERGIQPDLVVGTSVGALNGAIVAANPSPDTVGRLVDLWSGLSRRAVFGGGILGQLGTLARHGTHLHGNDQLRRLIDDEIGGRTFADLPVRFQCVAANIERAAAHWFVDGPVTDAVLASCAVPGLLPPVEIGGQHYLDGGLVSSVPVGRAVGLGARRIYVLQVGRLERPLAPPTRPWQVGLVAFEISRRHRFAEDMAAIPDGVEVVLLPSGTGPPSVSVRYRNPAAVPRRIDAAYGATTEVLGRLDGRPS